jgi:serine/threonine protein kinase
MEFISGVDLARIISQQPGPFPRDQVIAWADQLLDALIYLHSRDRQVIHRDIKPHNLKLKSTGQIALLDFGLARAQSSDTSVTASKAFFGYTRHYAPLEQIQDHHTDPRSDIYALGATLYHLLTGIKPPDAMVRAADVVNGGPDPLLSADKIHSGVGPEIAAILAKAMSQKPEDRYASANEFREALRRMGRHKSRHVNAEPRNGVDRRSPDISSTVHISDFTMLRAPESPVVNLALVASERRFGPPGTGAVLAIVLTLVAGALYGLYKWFPSPDGINAVMPANAASALRQTTSSRKSERARTTDAVELAPARPKSATDTNSIQSVESRSVAEALKSQTEKSGAVDAKTQAAVSGRSLDSTTSRKKVPSRPGAPSIRMPNPQLQDHAPVPSPDSRLRSVPSSSVDPKFYRTPRGVQMVEFSDGSTLFAESRLLAIRASKNAPRFYRTSDGTQMVKFPDGSTRLVPTADRRRPTDEQ